MGRSRQLPHTRSNQPLPLNVIHWNMSSSEACHQVKYAIQWSMSSGEACHTVKNAIQWSMSSNEACHPVLIVVLNTKLIDLKC